MGAVDAAGRTPGLAAVGASCRSVRCPLLSPAQRKVSHGISVAAGCHSSNTRSVEMPDARPRRLMTLSAAHDKGRPRLCTVLPQRRRGRQKQRQDQRHRCAEPIHATHDLERHQCSHCRVSSCAGPSSPADHVPASSQELPGRMTCRPRAGVAVDACTVTPSVYKGIATLNHDTHFEQ